MKKPFVALSITMSFILLALGLVGSIGCGKETQEGIVVQEKVEPVTLGEMKEKYGGVGQEADTSTLGRAFRGVWRRVDSESGYPHLYITEDVMVTESSRGISSVWAYRVMKSNEEERTLEIQYVQTGFSSTKGAAWSTAGTENAKFMFSQDRNKWQFADVGGGVYERGI